MPDDIRPLTDTELQAIRERADKATPGEWLPDERPGYVAVYAGLRRNCLDLPMEAFIFYRGGKHDKKHFWSIDPQSLADADFVAHARTDIPRLLAEIARLRQFSSIP